MSPICAAWKFINLCGSMTLPTVSVSSAPFGYQFVDTVYTYLLTYEICDLTVRGAGYKSWISVSEGFIGLDKWKGKMTQYDGIMLGRRYGRRPVISTSVPH